MATSFLFTAFIYDIFALIHVLDHFQNPSIHTGQAAVKNKMRWSLENRRNSYSKNRFGHNSVLSSSISVGSGVVAVQRESKLKG